MGSRLAAIRGCIVAEILGFDRAVARIVLNTFGSLGDLHPYLAIAIELRRRGHEPVIATSEVYRRKILAVRPDIGLVMDDPDFIARVWDRRRGGEFL
jgi:rhamnosyltransferase subunit B